MEGSVRVAVVDGNPGARQGLVRRLRQMPGISVVGEAADLDGARGMVRERQPDVVVLDLRRIAPEGAECLGELESAAPRMGIVILTAYVTERERADLTRAGAQAVLLKEIDSEALARAIQTVARPQRGAAP